MDKPNINVQFFRNSTKAECEGLEIAAVWADNYIIDRIMGDDTWNKL